MKIAESLSKFKEDLLLKQIGEVTNEELEFLEGSKATHINGLVTPYALGVGVELIKNKRTRIEALNELDITEEDIEELSSFLYSSDSLDNEIGYFNQGRKQALRPEVASVGITQTYAVGFVCGQIEYELTKEKGKGM